MNIVQDNKGITIDQINYAKKIVERFGQQNCKPTHTSLPAGYKPSKNTGKADSKQITYYQSIIGSLLWSDIAEAVIKLSQFSVNPSKEHIDKALYILKYVNTTINCKIAYNKKEEIGRASCRERVCYAV